MKPIMFDGMTIVIARDQPPFLPLPASVTGGPLDRVVTTCWALSWRERLTVLCTGRMWVRQKTFGEMFQPQKLQVENPLSEENP